MLDGLPATWCAVRGGDLFEVVRGVTYAKPQASDLPADGRIAIYRAGNLQAGQILDSDLVWVESDCVSEGQILRPGDMVVAMSSGSSEIVGKVSTYPGSPAPRSFGAFCGGIRPSTPAVADWLRQFFQSRHYRQTVSDLAAGVNINNLKRDHLESLELALPPEAEQRRIVAKLDALQSRTRLAREALAAIPTLLDHYRQSVLAAAFRGELTSKWRDANRQLVSADDALRAAKAKVIDSKRLHQLIRRSSDGATDTPLPDDLPTSWCAKSVRELVQSGAITDFQDGNHGALYPRKTEFGSTGILFLTATQIVDGVVRLNEAPRLNINKAKELRIGHSIPRDVLLTHNATVGRVAIMPSVSEPVILGTSVTYYRCNDAVLLPEYLRFFFNGHYWQSQMQSVMEQTTRDQVSVNKQVEFTIIVPPIAEQIEIVRRVSCLFSHVGKVVENTATLRTGVDHLDQSLLSSAFRGELVPQDPNDEPASVLLDRIRAARAQVGDAPRTRRKTSPGVDGMKATRTSTNQLNSSASDPYATLLTALRAKGSLTSADAQAATDLDATGVRPLLQQLVAEGAATIKGQKRGTRYTVNKGGKR